jgi:hypothetical protein
MNWTKSTVTALCRLLGCGFIMLNWQIRKRSIKLAMLIPLARFTPQRTLLPAQLLFRAHYGQLPVVTEVATQKIKHNTTSPTPLTPPSPHHTDSQLSIYDGPFSQTAKRLKLFSVSSLGATVALCPFIFLLDAGISNGMRGGLAVAGMG